jgi:pyruvate/2-oxoacid:ferredoxin oxidoreductase beta subunit
VPTGNARHVRMCGKVCVDVVLHEGVPLVVASGANAANRDLVYIVISGDGDSLSIGLGQLCHAIRRNVNVLYVLENNGVYGQTKGQFSASADPGSVSKKGEANTMEAIDGCLLALSLGATFVARSFSGDKAQLVPILKAGLSHQGFAFIDVISPCVTFNDHEGSTKSYAYAKVQEKLGHDKKMIESLEEAVKLEPTQQSLKILADTYERTGQQEAADKIRKKLEKSSSPPGTPLQVQQPRRVVM